MRPLDNKEDQEKLLKIADLASRFVARYVYNLAQNGADSETCIRVAVSLTPSIVAHLLAVEANSHTAKDQVDLKEWEPGDSLPN